jgi:autotransporter translocation and assembly factor TamB
VRDALASSVNTWLTAMRRAIEIAVEEGHLRADTDAAQMGFEIHAQILALHYEARFLRSPASLKRALAAFEGIVTRFSAARAAPPAARTRKTAAPKA